MNLGMDLRVVRLELGAVHLSVARMGRAGVLPGWKSANVREESGVDGRCAGRLFAQPDLALSSLHYPLGPPKNQRGINTAETMS